MTKGDWGKTALKDAGLAGVLLYVLIPTVQKHGDRIDELQAEISAGHVTMLETVNANAKEAKSARTVLSRRLDHATFSISMLAGKDDFTLPDAPDLSTAMVMPDWVGVDAVEAAQEARASASSREMRLGSALSAEAEED